MIKREHTKEYRVDKEDTVAQINDNNSKIIKNGLKGKNGGDGQENCGFNSKDHKTFFREKETSTADKSQQDCNGIIVESNT